MILSIYTVAVLFVLTFLAPTHCSIGVDLSIVMTVDEWTEFLAANPDVSFAVIHIMFYNGTINPGAVSTLQNAWDAGLYKFSLYMHPCIKSSVFARTYTSTVSCGTAEEQLQLIVDTLSIKRVVFENRTSGSFSPTATPTVWPTEIPTFDPSLSPTVLPTPTPSTMPSSYPTNVPTKARVTDAPTPTPSSQPSSAPSTQPSSSPSTKPTSQPSGWPSAQPSASPSCSPTSIPTSRPTMNISEFPTSIPSGWPSSVPTSTPTSIPSAVPTSNPTSQPSRGIEYEIDQIFINVEDEVPNRYFSQNHADNVEYLSDFINAAHQMGIRLGIYTTKRDWRNVMTETVQQQDVYPTNTTKLTSNPFTALPLWLPRYDSVNSLDFFSPFAGWDRALMKQTSGGTTALRRIGSSRIGTNYLDDATNTSSADLQSNEDLILELVEL